LIAAGSIGLSQDISDAGEAARQSKKKKQLSNKKSS